MIIYHLIQFSSLLLALISHGGESSDQTESLQRLLDSHAGKSVTFPAGTYLVRSLTLPRQTRLTIGANTTIKGLPIDQALPLITIQSGCHVNGNGLLDGNRTKRSRGAGIRMFDAQGVSIDGIRIREVAEQGIQMAGCKQVTLTNVQVNGCGAKGVDQFQGINIVTSQNVRVAKCRVSNAQHGIQWWGDDTNGWCENINISRNQVQYVNGGGIWGNKGRNVTISSNTAETCGDVGIDFEHSSNCTAIANTVRNCKNYALAVFHGSERVTFTNNNVYQSLKYGHGIGLIGDELNQQISFIGGTIRVKGPTSCGLITVGTNVARDILVKGIRIVTEGNEGIPIRVIDNNRFQILNNPLISGVSSTGVSLEGSSQSTVAGNLVAHIGFDASKRGERGGIFIYFRSSAYPAQNNQITNNTIRLYSTGINDECWGNVNSNNLFKENITPNLTHRASNGVWGGKTIQNRTNKKIATPIDIKQ